MITKLAFNDIVIPVEDPAYIGDSVYVARCNDANAITLFLNNGETNPAPDTMVAKSIIFLTEEVVSDLLSYLKVK